MTATNAASANVTQFPGNVDIMRKAKCAICGHEDHSLINHLRDAHGSTADQYLSLHPGAEVLSPFGKKVFDEMVKRPDIPAALQYKEKAYDSMATFGVGFGAKKAPKPIRGYEGFGHDDGVPQADPNYFFTDTARDVLMGMMAGAKIYAKGPTGSGKTTLYEQISARLGRPFFRQQFHGEMEPTELTGNWFVNERGVMEYMYSGLVRALQLPSIVCLDEYDSGNAVVSAIANALLEGKPLVLANKGGEKIQPHKDCIIVATGNTAGMGDDTGLYASTSVQSFATMNRFGMFVNIDYMTEEEEKALLLKIHPTMPPEFARDICKVAKLVRDGFVGGSVSVVLSTRQVLNWARWIMMTGDERRSFELSFANQLGGPDRAVVDQLFQRVFGSGKGK